MSFITANWNPLGEAFYRYKYLALFTDTGHLWTGSSHLQDKLSEVDTKKTPTPKHMVWFPLEDPCVLVGELDGVRIISSTNQELLQEVPLVCQDMFKIASMAPGALLLEAHREYEFYPLAIEMCRYLKIPDYQGVSRVLKHWASCKVQQKDLSDDAIARVVCVKVGDSPGVSYSHIAAKAYECGRTELAIKLLDSEARSGEQVPLLLKMKRSQLALSKAVESGDTDLVYTVVSYLKNEMNRGDFFMTLRNQPVALSLYRQFCKLQEQETLKDLYNQDDDHQELANYYVTASYREKSAIDEYNKAKNEFSAKMTEDEMRLLRFQRKLDDEKGAGLLGLSLQATMEALLSLGLHKQTEQLYRDFRVPDKRYWWLKLMSLAEKEEWEELEKFSKSKKSPIGYLAFVDVCMKSNNKYEAKKYVSKVTPEQKVKAHLAVSDLEGAADAAIERKNDAEMGAILSRCSASDRLLIDRLNRARAAAAKK
ncbi:hypothetical protein F2P81_002891 [Scophthalmus maximus]|uniref:Vacuolar protein sorting-associated protein 16 homolog n=1 Tax=Scophthalmus maximus TaxID=52904 RepID=A0A6A4TWE5_SCOMX|nr:hypothetical protein F2P81_002891 [Scophthalmus maximus]